MKFTRRNLLAGGWLAGAGALLRRLLGRGPAARAGTQAAARAPATTATTSICPFCAVGCGIVVHTRAGRLVDISGDPAHPINQGTLCAKGAALSQLVESPRRLRRVYHRAPGAADWRPVSWDWALDRIAALVKQSRDRGFRERDEQGRTVNRTENLACLGGAALDNEECYLYGKLARALGIVYLEHQARI